MIAMYWPRDSFMLKLIILVGISGISMRKMNYLVRIKKHFVMHLFLWPAMKRARHQTVYFKAGYIHRTRNNRHSALGYKQTCVEDNYLKQGLIIAHDPNEDTGGIRKTSNPNCQHYPTDALLLIHINRD